MKTVDDIKARFAALVPLHADGSRMHVTHAVDGHMVIHREAFDGSRLATVNHLHASPAGTVWHWRDDSGELREVVSDGRAHAHQQAARASLEEAVAKANALGHVKACKVPPRDDGEPIPVEEKACRCHAHRRAQAVLEHVKARGA